VTGSEGIVRSRILRVAVLAVTVAVTLFGVPLAIAVHALLYSDETNELERLALRGAVTVSSDAGLGDPIELPRTESSVQLGIYDLAGQRIAGTGPARGDQAVQRSLGGQVADHGTAEQLVVAVPVSVGEGVVAVSRAASPRSALQRTVAKTWAGMFVLALAAGGCACVFAAAQARRVNRPLERLVEGARELGAGNFDRRVEPSGVEEIDRAGEALNLTAQQLDELLSRERAFSAHASHQLRTPLTALRLGLETALATPGADLQKAAQRAVVAAEHLSRTVDDVLSLARGSATNVAVVDVHDMLAGVRERWHGALAALGRPLRIDDDSAPRRAVGSEAGVRQILDVLLDNALRHGRGEVTVVVRETDTAVAIDVIDDGSTRDRPLLPTQGDRVEGDATVARLGLAMATALAERQGGRLLHARTEPRTRLTLLLAQADG
jgi:signal transduction histidine kinase